VDIINALQSATQALKTLVVASLLQPPPEVFSTFDEVRGGQRLIDQNREAKTQKREGEREGPREDTATPQRERDAEEREKREGI
jgi:hypothetical protein